MYKLYYNILINEYYNTTFYEIRLYLMDLMIYTKYEHVKIEFLIAQYLANIYEYNIINIKI